MVIQNVMANDLKSIQAFWRVWINGSFLFHIFDFFHQSSKPASQDKQWWKLLVAHRLHHVLFENSWWSSFSVHFISYLSSASSISADNCLLNSVHDHCYLKVIHQPHILFICSLFLYLRMLKLYYNGHPKYLKADDMTLQKVAFFLDCGKKNPHLYLAKKMQILWQLHSKQRLEEISKRSATDLW